MCRMSYKSGDKCHLLSSQAYKGRVGSAVARPITSRVRGYPLAVALPQPEEVSHFD